MTRSNGWDLGGTPRVGQTPGIEGRTVALHAALRAEAVAVENHRRRYLELREKMRRYQDGCGPPPTDAEFAEWREGVAVVQEIKRLRIDKP